MKTFAKYSTILFTLIIVVVLYNYTNDIRCVLIKRNNDFQEIKSNLFVSKNLLNEEKDSLINLVQLAKLKLKEFWGDYQIEPIIIYIKSKEQYNKYGVKSTPASTRLGQYVVITSDGLQEDIITHEICHTIIFDKIGQSYYQYYNDLPSWLDEGIALLFDHRKKLYPRKAIIQHPPITINELKVISAPNDFYAPDRVNKNYFTAKVEVERFVKSKGKEKLFDILEKIKKGEDVMMEYNKLRK